MKPKKNPITKASKELKKIKTINNKAKGRLMARKKTGKVEIKENCKNTAKSAISEIQKILKIREVIIKVKRPPQLLNYLNQPKVQ